MTTLKQKTISGVIWNSIGKFGNQGLTFIVSIILARLIEPKEFGIIAMLSIFIAISQTFINSGLTTALIQKKNATDEDFSTVFYFNLLVSIFFYFILYICAPFISNFYSEPQLTKITRVLGIILIIDTFAAVHISKLQKNIDFKTQSKITILSTVLSGPVGIILAFCGYGVWSLVLYQIATRFFNSLFYWIFDKWRPKLIFSINSFKELFGYGSKLLASGLLNTTFNNVYNIIIGKYYNAASLGFYDRAKKLQMLAINNINSTIQVVTFPVLSQIQDNKKKLSDGYKKILELLVFVNFPAMILLLIIAKPLIIILLTEKWAQSIPYLQLLCVSGILFPLHSLNLNILKVKGRSDLFLQLEVIKKILIVITILISIKYGIKGLIIGQIFSSVIAYFINSYYSGKFIDLNTKKQILIILPYLFIASIVGMVTYFIGNLSFNSNIILLVFEIFVFAISYLLLSKLFKLNAYFEAKNIFLYLMKKNKK